MDDLLDGFSAFHAGYRDLEFVVLFYSPYVEVGESARATLKIIGYSAREHFYDERCSEI